MNCPVHLMTSTGSVQRPTNTVDSGGSPIQTYAAHLGNIRCRIQPLSASERQQYAQTLGDVSHAVYVEGGQDIKASDRFVYGTAYYDIYGVVDFDKQAIYLKLICAEYYGMVT